MNILRNIFLVGIVLLCSCEPKLKKEDKIFHANAPDRELSGIFFSLYKNNKYEFCEGDFMDYGCYTGNYSMNGDTIIFDDLDYSGEVSNNRFIIYRYEEQDWSYWEKKYPKLDIEKEDWTDYKASDKMIGSTGDVFELDENNIPQMDLTYYYIIRQDDLITQEK